MPLMHGKSKPAFVENLKTEMHAGKPKKQALAIAYSVQRQARKKKMSDGGMAEKPKTVGEVIGYPGFPPTPKPSPEPKKYADGGEVKKPKLGTGKRFSDLEHHLEHEKGIHDPAALAASIGRKKFGSHKMAMLSAKGRKMADGGYVQDVDGDEEQMDESLDYDKAPMLSNGGMIEHEDDEDLHSMPLIEAIMHKRKMADGGMVDDEEVDLDDNAIHHTNQADKMNFDAADAEMYSEQAGLDELDQPMDSNEHGDELSDEDEHDMVKKVMRKIRK